MQEKYVNAWIWPWECRPVFTIICWPTSELIRGILLFPLRRKINSFKSTFLAQIQINLRALPLN